MEEGLLCCCDDCEVCCVGMLCPCITYGNIARDLANGDEAAGTRACQLYCISMLFGFSVCLGTNQRVKVKTMVYAKDSRCDGEDCCVHCWCPSFALCQEKRATKEALKDRAARAVAASPQQQFMS